jgi:hypothetical protein
LWGENSTNSGYDVLKYILLLSDCINFVLLICKFYIAAPTGGEDAHCCPLCRNDIGTAEEVCYYHAELYNCQLKAHHLKVGYIHPIRSRAVAVLYFTVALTTRCDWMRRTKTMGSYFNVKPRSNENASQRKFELASRLNTNLR